VTTRGVRVLRQCVPMRAVLVVIFNYLGIGAPRAKACAMRSVLALALLPFLIACTEVGDDDEASGGGGAGGADANCSAPDTSCPSEMPFPGAPCTGALACDYDDPVTPWHWDCVDGRWSGTPDCSEIVGGACGVPESAEACPGPFSGTLSGATVAIGPSEVGKPFRAFQSGEPAEIVWGPQGGAMIFYRVQVDGADVPGCVSITITVTPTGMSPHSVERPVRLRCGETLSMYEVLPEGGCVSSDPVETMIRVEVAGVGTAEVILVVPGDAFCAALG
jgi:hypothetical protein